MSTGIGISLKLNRTGSQRRKKIQFPISTTLDRTLPSYIPSYRAKCISDSFWDLGKVWSKISFKSLNKNNFKLHIAELKQAGIWQLKSITERQYNIRFLYCKPLLLECDFYKSLNRKIGHLIVKDFTRIEYMIESLTATDQSQT